MTLIQHLKIILLIFQQILKTLNELIILKLAVEHLTILLLELINLLVMKIPIQRLNDLIIINDDNTRLVIHSSEQECMTVEVRDRTLNELDERLVVASL